MSERYVIRPAAGNAERVYEIFDTGERRTIATFTESTGAARERQVARGDPDPHALALEFVYRMNAQDEEHRAASAARLQLGESIKQLGSADVTQMAEALAAGGALRVVVRR